MTREELEEAKNNDTMRDEVQEIADSPAFRRFIDGRSLDELGNLIQHLDPVAPDGMKPLNDAYETAAREQEMFDREYDPIYQSMFGTEEAKNELMNDLGGLLADENFRNSVHDDGIGRVCITALEKLNDVLFEDNPQAVKKGIDQARAGLTFMQTLVGDSPQYKKLQSFPALERIRNRLQLPAPDTGKEFSMSIRGAVLNEGTRSFSGHKYLFRKVVFAQEARNNPDIENAKVDKNALYKMAEELEYQTIPLGNVLEELSAEEAYQIVDANDGGAKAEKYLRDWMAQKVRARQEVHEKTPEERVEELLSLPARERYIQLKVSTAEDRAGAVREVLAARSLSREYREHPEKFGTAEDVDERFNSLKGSYNVFEDAMDYIQQNEMFLVWKDKTGAELEAAYKKAMPGEDRLEYWQNADPVMYPTAREQIEALQRRLKTDERLNSSVRTRNALSLILAAREMLHVRRGIRGGDERLDQTMNAGIFARADEIYETLGTLPAEQLKALREKAREGHGGALEEDYHAILRKKAAAEEQVRGDANRDQLPTAKERIEALQARLRTTQDPAEKLRCVAGIIAARQTVGAQRGGMFGGDKRLNDTLDPAKLAEREQDVALYMSNLPEKVQNALAAQAEEGHGGAMMETYREANTVKTQMDGLRTRALGGEPVDMARAIALAIVKKGDKDSPEPLDEDAVRKNMLLTRKMPGYEAFAGDPKALDLLKSGNYPRLVVNYRDHVAKAQENQFAEQVREQGKREGPQEAENDLEHQLQ